MTLDIKSVGEPVLRQTARALTTAEIRSSQIQDLIENMRETMRNAPGVGLAAPQIGISVQLAVIEDRAEYQKDIAPELLSERERKLVPFHVIVNPYLTATPDGRAEFFEGCLSLPGFTALVDRARTVRVECLDQRGEPLVIKATGWYARILQHEIDHLHGKLYIDRMRTRSFCTLDHYAKHWKDLPLPETLARLGL